MIIKELNLIGFGQFNNKVIELKNGLNIIFGKNEAGKTTIHNFINGMFYGFLKPYATRTNYTEEHAKYDPWNNQRYAGVLKFTYDGKEYRIERDFIKNHESTNVILDETGEDITNKINTGDAGRVLQPGHHFFGFNDAVFSNTLSIKQMCNRTENSLANEVRDKLVNVSTTLDDNLSIEDAIEELDKSIKDIGTIRATTSPYGKSFSRLERLRERKRTILDQKDEYNELLAKKKSYDNDLNIKLDNHKQLEKRLEDANILARNKIYLEANSLKNAIAELDVKVEENKKFAYLSMDDYSAGIDLKSRIKSTEEKIQEYENRLKEIDNRIEELERNKIEEDKSLSNIDTDYQRYEELEEEKNNLKYNDYASELQFIDRDYKESQKDKNKFNLRIILSIIVTLLSIGLSYFLSNYMILLINIITIPMLLYFLYKLRSVNGLLIRIDNQYKDIEDKEKSRKESIDSIEKSLGHILSKYNVKTKLELKKSMDENQYKLFNIKQKEDNLKESKADKEYTINKTNMLKETNEAYKKELNRILSDNHSKDLEEFKQGLEKKNIHEDSLTKISSKTALLGTILGNFQIENLANEINNYHKDISSIDETMTVEQIESDISSVKDKISDIKIEISRYEERVNNLNNEISKLVVIDESIDRLEKYLSDADKQKEALNLAKSTIEDISKDIHRQFAPMINEKVGNIIEDITGGKYTSVKIDNSLEIGVINPDTQEIINIENLSGGTIDQLYFALRFGIVDSINNEGLPLILDDCFIQYDDSRLKNIIEFLYKKSKERQIILFTCHNRENKILDEMKVEYNLINLNS